MLVSHPMYTQEHVDSLLHNTMLTTLGALVDEGKIQKVEAEEWLDTHQVILANSKPRWRRIIERLGVKKIADNEVLPIVVRIVSKASD